MPLIVSRASKQERLLHTHRFAFEGAVQPPPVAFHHRPLQENFWTQPGKTKKERTGGRKRAGEVHISHKNAPRHHITFTVMFSGATCRILFLIKHETKHK